MSIHSDRVDTPTSIPVHESSFTAANVEEARFFFETRYEAIGHF
jgi:hypothetical protein